MKLFKCVSDINPNRPGVLKDLYSPGGGQILPPPVKSMFPSIYIRIMHVITLFFYGEFDENGFISIQSDQDGLGRREQHPG